jgi:hypothetical protein
MYSISPGALLDQLESSNGQLNSAKLGQAISLLRALGDLELGDEHICRLRVPDRHAIMRPHHEVHYNDHGHRATQVEVPPGDYATHAKIDLELARLLRLRFLSTIALPTDDDLDEDDMEERLTTRISNVLRQYTPEQSFLEFVANAVDAGATKVELVLDNTCHQVDGDLITSEMRQFQGPSLVVYNNAIFKDLDWKGIRRIGQGGKAGQDTIGRFGLGALSMFHFTEVRIGSRESQKLCLHLPQVATIVSNDHVMFIDPSRQHITSQKNRATKRVSLHTASEYVELLLSICLRLIACRFYIDQLRPLEGLFGYDSSCGHFNGVSFCFASGASSYTNACHSDSVSPTTADP